MRLRQNPPHKDGSPGRYYLRVRIAPAAHLKPVLRDFPLETCNKGIAVQRARFLLRCLVRAGRQVMGDLSGIRAPKRKRKTKPAASYTPLLPLQYPQKKD